MKTIEKFKAFIRSKFDVSFAIKTQLFFSCLVFTVLSFYALSLQNYIKNINHDRPIYARFFEPFKQGQGGKKSPQGQQSIAKIILPTKLAKLPFADKNNIVVKTKKITIRNVPAPYNASIIKYGSGYLIFFRYDIKTNKDNRDKNFSYIGCAELDTNFEQTEREFTTLNTGNHRSEDPRVFSIGEKNYILYVVSTFPKGWFTTTMNIGELDLEKRELKFKTDLELNWTLVEKNWGPFEYIDNKGLSHLYLQYNLNPHKILQLPDPKVNHCIYPIFPREDVFQTIEWENDIFGWGKLRGGTPALNLGNEYLGFFHTCFIDKDKMSWYSMGAYTFDNHPPFRINATSPHPILFDGIYETTCLNTADANRTVIFPVNFVIAKENGKEVIHLCCGENDSAIKIVTLDKDNLLKSLKKTY